MSDLKLALAKIQKDLNAPKNQYNKFGKYYYRSCEDILEGLKKVLGECVVTVSDEMIEVGNRIYVKATATISLGTESESVTGYAREGENKKGFDDAQLTGSTSTYARKYALNGLFLIDDNKDADSNERATQVSNAPVNHKSSPEIEAINNAIKDNDHMFVFDNWKGSIATAWNNLNEQQIIALNNLIKGP